MNNIVPLFMWAGGKNKMIKHYKSLMPYSVRNYFEPFFGGGAMFLFVMKNYTPKKIVINDINKEIMSIYSSIQNNVSLFIECCKEQECNYLSLSKENRKIYYYNIRNQYAFQFQKWSVVEQSVILYFLMKTGFNGIYQINKNTNNRYGTPCGLLNQKNNIFNYENIKKWNVILQNVEILSDNWKSCFILKPTDSFLFFDPPYRGCFTSYGQSFQDEQQTELLKFCEDCSKDNDVFLCNRDIDDSFFDNTSLQKHKFDITYTAGRRKKTQNGFEAKKATEILLCSNRETSNIMRFFKES